MTIASWRLRSRQDIEYYELDAGPDLAVLFITRKGGTSKGDFAGLNLSGEVGDQPSAVDRNLELLRRTLRLPPLVTLRQTHSDLVLPVFYSKAPADSLEGDALFTSLPGLALGIKVADCLPVYIYSRWSRAAGLAHCGWRGTASRIAEKLARAMARRLAVPANALSFALGPCICADCYAVGEDVVSDFRTRYPAAEKFLKPVQNPPKAGRFRLDIRAANRWLLSEMGLTETASLDLCTRENQEWFYSARRDQPTGRNLAVASILDH